MKRSEGRSCQGKKAHATKVQARAHMHNLIRKGNALLEVYKCPWCNQFHVGHRPKGKGWGRTNGKRRKRG